MRLRFQFDLQWKLNKVRANSLKLTLPLHSWVVPRLEPGSLAHFMTCGVFSLSTGSFPCQTLPRYYNPGALRNMKFMIWDFSSCIIHSSPFQLKSCFILMWGVNVVMWDHIRAEFFTRVSVQVSSLKCPSIFSSLDSIILQRETELGFSLRSGKSQGNCSLPHARFPHLYNGDHDGTYLIELLWGLKWNHACNMFSDSWQRHHSRMSLSYVARKMPNEELSINKEVFRNR